MAQFALGSISTGTLRTEDLLPTFADALKTLGGDSKQAFLDVDGDYNKLERLEACLQELCPPFVRFGAHEGDGADFGFWPDYDALEEANYCSDNAKFSPGNEYILEESNVIVQVKDHGNVTVMDMDRNILWSIV